MVRHPPVYGRFYTSPIRCARCGRDPLDRVHDAPRGVKERVLDFFGVLRE